MRDNTECWASDAIVVDRFGCLLLLEKSREQIAQMREREKKILDTLIWSVVIVRIPRQRSETVNNTMSVARNQGERVPMSITDAMKTLRLESIT
jgi:hypothetical protein